MSSKINVDSISALCDIGIIPDDVCVKIKDLAEIAAEKDLEVKIRKLVEKGYLDSKALSILALLKLVKR